MRSERQLFSILQPLEKERVRQMNPVVLAFVGDAAYTLYVRQKLVSESGYKTGELNKRASAVVSAHGQSDLLERILPLLTEEEADVYRRGRNAKKPTRSKNASPAEYNRSTGLEAVVGYLYLTGDLERIDRLFFGGEA